jgi:YegS/Rv2252/BmrU family lipid kinase
MRTLLLVNPKAGPRRGRAPVLDRVRAAARRAGLDADLVALGPAGDGERLARQAIGAFDVVAAAGGDGTIHGVARGLIGSDTALGIVPLGSGNGLARDLGVSLDLERACRQLRGGRPRPFDVGYAGPHPFLMTAGFGIDARVGHRFERQASGRGQLAYFRIALATLWRYRPVPLALTVAGERRRLEPLLLTAANTRQFGSGAVIAPRAAPDDGLLDLVVVGRASPLGAVRLAVKLFNGSIDLAAGVEVTRTDEALIEGDGPLEAHTDGEPRLLASPVHLGCRRHALRLWAPV